MTRLCHKVFAAEKRQCNKQQETYGKAVAYDIHNISSTKM
jgi:hypothetical protein